VDEELEYGSQAIDKYLLMLSLAYVAEARCYLELGESETALFRLQEGTEKIRERVHRYVEILLTSNPAAYLHPRHGNEIGLEKLTKIYQWLDPTLDEAAVFELQRKNLFSLVEVKTLSQLGMTFEEWDQLTPVSDKQSEGATLMVLVPAEPVAV
jgi:hypothetical protein